MELMRTIKTELTATDILKAIDDYEANVVPDLSKLWAFYEAKNPAILARPAPDTNNPDNKTVVSYGRKLVNTFQGYAYRPGYITYKSENTAFLDAVQETFRLTNEKVKTSRTGRNTGVFGVAYELLYVDSDGELPTKAEPLFINVDPRSMIVMYDYAPEPNIVVAIRFYRVDENTFKVEVYYPDTVITYDRVKNSGSDTWRLENEESEVNYFGAVPVVAYYMGDEMIGVIEPVRTLINDYDVLLSDSMNEFDRFSNAYLILKKMSLTPPQKKEAESYNRALRLLKRRRVFENVPADGDVKFLLKDTPTAFIQFVSEILREEIHKQSHVPDFMSEALGGNVSGVAVARMMFDFENLVSSAEGDFDLGLMERLRLMSLIYSKTKNADGDYWDITISHKRNVPQNVKEFAETAKIMKEAGFSSYLVADMMPDDIVPDVDAELERQRAEKETMFGDSMGGFGDEQEDDA